jgi:hypothetical protein
MTTNSPELDEARLAELLAICESASTGDNPWREGIKNVWCETTNECVAVTYRNRLADDKQFAIAAHIAAFDPSTCAALVREVLELRDELKTACAHGQVLSEEVDRLRAAKQEIGEIAAGLAESLGKQQVGNLKIRNQ